MINFVLYVLWYDKNETSKIVINLLLITEQEKCISQLPRVIKYSVSNHSKMCFTPKQKLPSVNTIGQQKLIYRIIELKLLQKLLLVHMFLIVKN